MGGLGEGSMKKYQMGDVKFFEAPLPAGTIGFYSPPADGLSDTLARAEREGRVVVVKNVGAPAEQRAEAWYRLLRGDRP